ncbi:hypothetical protein MNBD_NITROSPINAE03-1273 [hydrothermal vent metagenome]|uniref:Response regulatory domain-containing protein n=1 Tax=hydrothermal vent metagenome TaxID=652676 RepID=A0A3B1BVC3_9ZZZZ
MRSIVVDDMGPMRKTVSLTLRDIGITNIEEAKNGQEAFETIVDSLGDAKKPIELAIVDWNMEPGTGLDLLQMIRRDKRTQEIIFIMITAEQLQDNVVSAVQSGVDEYIIKPFTPGMVKEKFIDITRRKLAEIRKEINGALNEEAPLLDNEKALELSGAQISEYQGRIMRLMSISHWTALVPMELGRFFLKIKDYAEAENWLRKVIKQNFGTTDGHKLLSTVLHRQGKTEEAAKELEIAAAARPGSGELKHNLAEMFLNSANYIKAANLFVDSIRLFEDKISKKIKGSKNTDQKDFVSMEPLLFSAHYNLIVVYKKLGNSDEAQNVLKRIQWMEPKDANGWLALGKAFLDKSDGSKAKFPFNKACEMTNGDYDIYKEACSALYSHGMFDDAIYFLEKTKRVDPSNIFAPNLKGIIHRKRNEIDAALKEYEIAARIDPDNAAIQFNMGMAHFKSGNVEEGKKHFAKARQIDPELGEAGRYLEKLPLV